MLMRSPLAVMDVATPRFATSPAERQSAPLTARQGHLSLDEAQQMQASTRSIVVQTAHQSAHADPQRTRRGQKTYPATTLRRPPSQPRREPMIGLDRGSSLTPESHMDDGEHDKSPMVTATSTR
jgi:hypothetical protein